MRSFAKSMVAVCLTTICSLPVRAEPTIENDENRAPHIESGEITTQPAQPVEKPVFFPLNPSGDLARRPALTGDWGGVRSELAAAGISFRAEVLQFGLGNAHGGASTNNSFNYSGSADYILEFDTWRMHLWPGGYIKLRGETVWGEGINGDVGAISPPSFDNVLPRPEPGLTTLTEAYIMQFLGEKAFVLGGKVDLTRLPGQNVFASDPYHHFLNTSLWQPPVSFALMPYTAMTAGFGLIPAEWFDMATFILDAYGSPSESGFDTAFHSPNGATLLQAFNFHIKPFGLPGNQRFNVAWSSRERIDLDDLGRSLLAGQLAPSFDRLNLAQGLLNRRRGLFRPRRFIRRTLLARVLAPEPRPDDWAFWYDFDQYLYTEVDDPTQGIGVFGKFGWSPGDSNPGESYYAVGVGGKGVLPDRDGDRFGVGYFHLNLNDGLPDLLSIHSEQGVEAFYNIEIFPWLHLTPDLQVIIDPGGGFRDRDVSLVYGLRLHTSL